MRSEVTLLVKRKLNNQQDFGWFNSLNHKIKNRIEKIKGFL